MKNVIFGAMQGYDYADSNVFLSSLECAGYQGDVVMFINNMRGTPRAYQFPVIWQQYQPGPLMIHDHRFLLALEHLLRYQYQGNVMIADVRDVLFQSDPFKYKTDRVVFSLEDTSDTIGSCRFNSYWIRETFGPAILADMADKYISCCGVTFGPAAAMLQYLLFMSAFIYPGRRGPAVGVDTAAHNFILRRHLIPATEILNEHGPVLTTGKMKVVKYDGKFYNADGSCPAVVHQYDRQKEIAAQVAVQYAR